MPVWDSINLSFGHHYYFPDNFFIVLKYLSPSPAPVIRLLILYFCRSVKWPTIQLQSWTGTWQWRPKNSLGERPPGQRNSRASFWWTLWVADWQLSPLSTWKTGMVQLSVLVRPSHPVRHQNCSFSFSCPLVTPFCSATGGPQRASIVNWGPLLGSVALTVTLLSNQNDQQA